MFTAGFMIANLSRGNNGAQVDYVYSKLSNDTFYMPLVCLQVFSTLVPSWVPQPLGPGDQGYCFLGNKDQNSAGRTLNVRGETK